jgi:adenosylcobinamide-GDP ribazoletransferase
MDANTETSKPSRLAQFRLATAFLTRLPAEKILTDEDAFDADTSPDPIAAHGHLASAMWLFPLVGFGIGGTGAIVLGLLTWIGTPTAVAATLAVGAMILLTGALHEDGLADIADGFGGGKDKASKLRIMRDSRIGTYGVVAVAIVLIAKITAVSTIAEWDVGAAAAALIAATTWSRALFAPTMRWLSPARSDGLGADAGTPGEGTSWLGLGLAIALSVLVLLTPAGFGVVPILAAGGLAAFVVGWIALKQIGGYTGDVLGAGQQLAEAATLVAASAIILGQLA